MSAARYILGESGVTDVTVRAVLERTHVMNTSVPFPQADSFARVISLLENPVDKADMPEEFGFTPRQADYYTNAARYLGLTELSGTRDERNLALVEALASRPVFREMVQHVVDTHRAVNKEEAMVFMRAANLGLGETTLRRRSATVAAWSHWLAELLQA